LRIFIGERRRGIMRRPNHRKSPEVVENLRLIPRRAGSCSCADECNPKGLGALGRSAG
jgi:hypothetical protein